MFRLLRPFWKAFLAVFSSPVQTALYIAALEQQLACYQATKPQPRISFWDRCFWVFLFRHFAFWRQALVFVQPQTVIAWHRKGYQALWRWRSKPGRPQLNQKLIRLIQSMSRDNPIWGAARIKDELEKLGHFVAIETVRKYALPSTRNHSPSPRHSQSWKSFLKSHSKEILACDFVTQHLAHFQTAYVFSIIHLETRKVLWSNVTKSPSLDWVKNQIREALAFNNSYKYLIHDNDGIFGQFGPTKKKLFGVRCNLDHWLRGIGLRGIPTPYFAPNANAYMERFNRSLREEALNHSVFLGKRHLLRVVREYVDYYNHARPSQGTGKIPDPEGSPPRDIQDARKVGDNVIAFPILDGLHHDYRRAA